MPQIHPTEPNVTLEYHRLRLFIVESHHPRRNVSGTYDVDGETFTIQTKVWATSQLNAWERFKKTGEFRRLNRIGSAYTIYETRTIHA